MKQKIKHCIIPAHFVLKDNKGIGKLVAYGHKKQNLYLKSSLDIYSDPAYCSSIIGASEHKILVNNLMYISQHSLN